MSIEGPISSFPNEMLVEVFSHLPPCTLGTICTVRKNWNELACLDEIWKKFYEQFCSNTPKTKDISFKKLTIQYNVNKDFIFIIDKSGSMKMSDVIPTRWDAVAASTHAVITQLLKRIHFFNSTKGIRVYFFSSSFNHSSIENPEQLFELFKRNEPNGTTNLTPVLDHIFRNHTKIPKSVILISDGLPDNPESTKKILKKTLGKQYDNNPEFELTLFQVGNDDNDQILNYFDDLDDEIPFLEVFTCDKVYEMGGLTQALLLTVDPPK